jgi:hypothetical protein
MIARLSYLRRQMSSFGTLRQSAYAVRSEIMAGVKTTLLTLSQKLMFWQWSALHHERGHRQRLAGIYV